MYPVGNIEELASILTSDGRRPFNVFVGSTISCTPPATAPSVPDILDSLLDELLNVLPEQSELRARADVRNVAVARDRLWAMPFESLWERVARVTGTAFVGATLMRLCSTGYPNFHHEAIAWLIRHGHVAHLFTTNYDEFIERALIADDRSVPSFSGFAAVDPMVVQLSSTAADTPTGFRCIKLHGTLSMPETMAFMFPQIAAGLSADTQRTLQELLGSCPVLFAGYGCNDWDLRRVLCKRIDSVWVTHRDGWQSVDERCRSLAQYHATCRWYRSDLRTGRPQDSVFEQLARLFGATASHQPVTERTTTRRFDILGQRDRADKLAILAELLDSLGLRIASDVFDEAAKAQQCARMRTRLEIGAYVASAHNMGIDEEQLSRGDKLFHASGLDPTEQTAVLCQLAFTYLIGASKFAGVRATLRLVPRIWRLERDAEARGLLLRNPAMWSADERLLATTIAKAREVLAHNILRVAWFHLPGTLGAAARCVRRFGVRHLLAAWARRILQGNRRWVSSIGELISIGGLEREDAHACCLTGRFDEAIERSLVADRALGWGRWYQWQANAIRTRGWVWLWIGGRVPRLRLFADQQAKAAFDNARELANKFAIAQGEMLDDRIKALLELKRLACLHGETFAWEEQLQEDLSTIAARNPTAHHRYELISRSPPKTREPLG